MILITDNLEKLRECFGKWVNLSIESDCRVIVTSEDTSIFRMGKREVKLGELCEDGSKKIVQKLSAGKNSRQDYVILGLHF